MKIICSLPFLLASLSCSAETPKLNLESEWSPVIASTELPFVDHRIFGLVSSVSHDGVGGNKIYNWQISTRFAATAFAEGTFRTAAVFYSLEHNFALTCGIVDDRIVSTSFLGAKVSGKRLHAGFSYRF